MKLRIAVNKSCKNKENPHKVASNWLNLETNFKYLQSWVEHGYGWCATHFVDGYRKGENSRGSNLIVIDIDGDVTLDQFWETDTAKNWCNLTYTSASHSETEHRFRALFQLEKILDTIQEHRAAYWLVVNRLVIDLGIDSLKDNCGQKPERLWYGNTSAIFKHNTNQNLQPIPKFLLNDIVYEETAESIASDITEIDIARCKWLLKSFLRPSEDEEYESYYVPVMAACAGIGTPVAEAWQDWVLLGHHGEKKSNTRLSKWKGLGNHSGFTSLYALAKKQDPNWTSHLPSDLKFNMFGGAFGYEEVAPDPDYSQIPSNEITNPEVNSKKCPPKSETKAITESISQPEPNYDVPAKKRGRPRGSSNGANETNNQRQIVMDYFPGLRYNEMGKKIENVNPKTGKVRVFEGTDMDELEIELAEMINLHITSQKVKKIVTYEAKKKRYSPIRDYLNHCKKEAIPFEQWDNIGEIFLGNKDPLAAQVLQRMMIGAVARAYKPGCSMSWLPILVGAQGAGKSMFARHLVPDVWNNAMFYREITTKLDKLTTEQYRLHIGWILELPEIDNYFKPRNIEDFKNLITTRIDETRRPYATDPESLARSFIFIGTTNRNQFLIDSSGNRRFIPLEIKSGFQIPWKKLTEVRDSLWSKAVEEYNSDARYEYTSGEIGAMSEYIQAFGDADPWTDKIANYISVREEVTSGEILVAVLDIDARHQTNTESRRVGEVLNSLGWRKNMVNRKDPITQKWKSQRLWQRPENDPLKEDHTASNF